MKLSKLLSTATAGILAVSIMTVSASADSVTKSMDIQDTGYGVSAGVSFAADGITVNESTLGDLAEKYDKIDFTISVADLGGRSDLTFQVYVSADNWAIWENGGGETTPIDTAGKEYKMSLDLDDIASRNGNDKVINDMGFQILSATTGAVEVTYSVDFTTNDGAGTDNESQDNDTDKEDIPTTGNNSVVGLVGLVSVSAVALAAKIRKK